MVKDFSSDLVILLYVSQKHSSLKLVYAMGLIAGVQVVLHQFMVVMVLFWHVVTTFMVEAKITISFSHVREVSVCKNPS